MKTILSQLEGAGILDRRAGKLRSLRTFSCMQEMADFLGEYERRYTSDRERLDQMMRYAETTFCRTRILREYFGEESGKDCGHCDNCRSKAEGKSNPPASPVHSGAGESIPLQVPPQPALSQIRQFHLGDRVQHRRFGTGQIVEISGRNLTVDFGGTGSKRIRGEYLQKAS